MFALVFLASSLGQAPTPLDSVNRYIGSSPRTRTARSSSTTKRPTEFGVGEATPEGDLETVGVRGDLLSVFLAR